MLERFFKTDRAARRLRDGPGGPILDGFAESMLAGGGQPGDLPRAPRRPCAPACRHRRLRGRGMRRCPCLGRGAREPGHRGADRQRHLPEYGVAFLRSLARARGRCRRGGVGAGTGPALLAESRAAEIWYRLILPRLHERRTDLARQRGPAAAADAALREARRLYVEMGAPLQVERLERTA